MNCIANVFVGRKFYFEKGYPPLHQVVVGHNVMYDRARVAEEYRLHRTSKLSCQ